MVFCNTDFIFIHLLHKFHVYVTILHSKNKSSSVSMWLLSNPYWLFINSSLLLIRFFLVVIKLNLQTKCYYVQTQTQSPNKMLFYSNSIFKQNVFRLVL